MLSRPIVAVVLVLSVQARAAAHRALRRMAEGVGGSCAKLTPFFGGIPLKREKNICKFEIPYESWKEGEPTCGRVVQRARVFDFKLDRGHIVTEGIECDDYFYNYNARLSGLLERQATTEKDHLLSYTSVKDVANFYSLHSLLKEKALYNVHSVPDDPHECIDAMNGLWSWICKENELPVAGDVTDEALAHTLLDRVCQMHAEKQRRFLEAISDGRLTPTEVNGNGSTITALKRTFGDRLDKTHLEGFP